MSCFRFCVFLVLSFPWVAFLSICFLSFRFLPFRAFFVSAFSLLGGVVNVSTYWGLPQDAHPALYSLFCFCLSSVCFEFYLLSVFQFQLSRLFYRSIWRFFALYALFSLFLSLHCLLCFFLLRFCSTVLSFLFCNLSFLSPLFHTSTFLSSFF